MLMDDNIPRNAWPLAKVSDVHRSTNGLVRAVTVKTIHGTFTRPITKLCQLEAAMEDDV